MKCRCNPDCATDIREDDAVVRVERWRTPALPVLALVSHLANPQDLEKRVAALETRAEELKDQLDSLLIRFGQLRTSLGEDA